jgi:hypothetical protein
VPAPTSSTTWPGCKANKAIVRRRNGIVNCAERS